MWSLIEFTCQRSIYSIKELGDRVEQDEEGPGVVGGVEGISYADKVEEETKVAHKVREVEEDM